MSTASTIAALIAVNHNFAKGNPSVKLHSGHLSSAVFLLLLTCPLTNAKLGLKYCWNHSSFSPVVFSLVKTSTFPIKFLPGGLLIMNPARCQMSLFHRQIKNAELPQFSFKFFRKQSCFSVTFLQRKEALGCLGNSVTTSKTKLPRFWSTELWEI